MPAKKAAAKKTPRAKKAAPKKATTKKAAPKAAAPKTDPAIAREIGARLKEIGGWQGKMLARLRALIHKADPAVVEEIKWRKPSNPSGVPIWSHAGIIVCTGEAYKTHVRLTFMNGGLMKDPGKVFNDGFGGARRVLVLKEGEDVDDRAFVDLVREAADVNDALAAARR